MIKKRILIAGLGFIILIPFLFAGGVVQVVIDGCGLSLSCFEIPRCISDSVGLLIAGWVCGKLQPDTKHPLLISAIFNPGIVHVVAVMTLQHLGLPIIYLFIPTVMFFVGCSLRMNKKTSNKSVHSIAGSARSE